MIILLGNTSKKENRERKEIYIYDITTAIITTLTIARINIFVLFIGVIKQSMTIFSVSMYRI